MIIIKVGGGKDINYDSVCQNIASLQDQVILVHGAKEFLEEMLPKLGNPPKWLTTESGYTSRRTDRKTMEHFTMVYAGLRNKILVEKLLQNGVNAVGLSGADGKLVVAKKKTIKVVENSKKKILRDDYTGKILEINKQLLDILLDNGYVPILCPPAISEENELLNVDGDRMTAMIAEAYGADTVIYLSNVPGLLKNKDDESSLISEIRKEDIESFMQYAEGTMKKKVMGAKEAIEKGVKRVIFADARIENPIDNALSGKGTVIR